MKRLVLGLVVILGSIPTIGCDSGGGTKPSTAPDAGAPPAAAPAAGPPAKKGGRVSRPVTGPVNPNGPDHDR
jgi:hypothetical protein